MEMMTATNKPIIQDWVQRIPFGKKTDGLKPQDKNESSKIEVEETISKDDYLQSIVSSKQSGPTSSQRACTGETSTCVCYRCLRQRRRAGNRMDTTRSAPEAVSETKKTAPRRSNTLPLALPRRSNTVRKTPTLKSYEKHIPRPTYSQQDSIYRLDTLLIPKTPLPESKQPIQSASSNKDSYQISWEDDRTGDDLLRPLVTFQSIFETTDQSEGLSELLEQKTKELKELNAKKNEPTLQAELPPRHPDCLTLSYRHGPAHQPLTLFHTMRMVTSKERGDAYDVAFQHCVQSDSGLRQWMERIKKPIPVKENTKVIQPINRKPRRSILSSIRRSHRMSRQVEEPPIFWSPSHVPVEISENPSEALETQPTDLLLAARALLPNQNDAITIKFNDEPPYEHIDAPGKPKHQPDKDSSSPPESSLVTRKASRSSKLLSFNKKISIHSSYLELKGLEQ